MPSTCVVLPVYNESRVIERTWREVSRYAKTHLEVEFCFVDDGSRDGTAAWLESAIKQEGNPRITLLAYTPNQGKGHAIQEGFAKSQSDLLIFTDGDLAYSLDHLERLHQNLSQTPVVIGSRELRPYKPRNSSVRRQILGRIFNRIARGIAGLPYRDTQAGLKGFQRAAAVKIFSHKRIQGFGFDVEILFLANKYGYAVSEIHAEVSAEHSYKVSKLKLLRDSVNMLGDLFRIRWNNALGHYE